MSKVRNISGVALDVPLLNRVVEPDEVVDVPDFQPGYGPSDKPSDLRYSTWQEMPIVWPPNRWEPVTDTSTDFPAADEAAS